MNYRSPLSFHCAPQNMYVGVVMPISGVMGVSYEKGDVIDMPPGSFAVVPSGCRIEFRYSTPFSLLSIIVQASALTGGLQRIAPNADSDRPRFGGMVATADSRRPPTIYGVSRLLVDVIDQYPSPDLIPANVSAALSDQVVSTFLLGLPHSCSEGILRSAVPISSRVVRRALEIIVSDVYAQQSVTDIARDIGVSVRSLELGFRKEFDCTPHEYMHRFRMQQAHDHLRKARPGDGTTVTDVASRWGFNHAGRFAAMYKRSYGTAPSDTLKRG
jgi:AraC-like DNA-binding protein